MANTNDFVPFAIGVGANVETPATWQADAIRSLGIVSGTLLSAKLNTVLRQSASVTAMIAQFTADHGPSNVQDNGDLVTLESQFTSALSAAIAGNLPGFVLKAGDTMTGPLNVPRLQLAASDAIVNYDPAAPLNEKYFDSYAANGVFVFRTVSDNYSTAVDVLTVTRNGTLPSLAWVGTESHAGYSSLSGGGSAPTMAPLDASQNLATTAFVTAAVNAIPSTAFVKSVNSVAPTSGTTNIQLVPANIGAVNLAGDTMTGGLVVPRLQIGATQSIVHYDPAAGVDDKYFDSYAASGQLFYRTVNDANTLATAWLTVTRTGITPALSWVGTETHSGYASLNGGASAPTMAAGDSSANVASTAFVTKAITAATPAGKMIAWADSFGPLQNPAMTQPYPASTTPLYLYPVDTGGGTLVIVGPTFSSSTATQTITFTFTNPQPDSNYTVRGLYVINGSSSTSSTTIYGSDGTPTGSSPSGWVSSSATLPLTTGVVTKSTTGFSINLNSSGGASAVFLTNLLVVR